MEKKIGVESCWGFGNFLFAISLPLCHIKENNLKNKISIIEANNCGYDELKNEHVKVSDYFFKLFDSDLEIEVTKEELFKKNKNNFLYKGFNFSYDLGTCKNYIIDCLKFSEKSEQLCENFLNKIYYKDSKKQYICLNIRDGDFEFYYKTDEILDPKILIELIDQIDEQLNERLPIVVNLIPKEKKEKYKNIFRKYIDRIYFCNIEYPMFLPIIAKSDYCIISNSTFYWWGAFLNTKAKKIFYPDPWFKVFNQKMWIPQDWMKINNYSKKEETIIHVGAYKGEEVPSYKKQYKKIIMIEADPDNFLALKEKYEKDPDVELINLIISDEEGVVPFYKTSNGQSNSIFKLNSPHINQFPYVKETKTINLNAKKLDSIITLNEKEKNTLVIDVQGAELKVLKGSLENLKKIEKIKLEINYEESYKECCLMHEIDEFLYNNNFKRTTASFQGCQGEAVYIKNNNNNNKIINLESEWLTIFDSNNPKDWLDHSLPLIYWIKKQSIKTDRLKIESNNFIEEIPIEIENLGKITSNWNGYCYFNWNSFHLGIINKQPTEKGKIIIHDINHDYRGGTGFGRIHYVGNKQGYSINGETVDCTNFKISIRKKDNTY